MDTKRKPTILCGCKDAVVSRVAKRLATPLKWRNEHSGNAVVSGTPQFALGRLGIPQ